MTVARVEAGDVTFLAPTWEDLVEMVGADDGEFDFTAASYEDVVRMYTTACWWTSVKNKPGAARLLAQVRSGLVPCLLTRLKNFFGDGYQDYVDFGEGRIPISDMSGMDIVPEMYKNLKQRGIPHPGVLPEVLTELISEKTEDIILAWQECVEQATISPSGKVHRRLRYTRYSNYPTDTLHLLTLNERVGTSAHPALGTVLRGPQQIGLLLAPDRTWSKCCRSFSVLETWLRVFPCRGYAARLVNLGRRRVPVVPPPDVKWAGYGKGLVMLSGPTGLVEEVESYLTGVRA